MTSDESLGVLQFAEALVHLSSEDVDVLVQPRGVLCLQALEAAHPSVFMVLAFLFRSRKTGFQNQNFHVAIFMVLMKMFSDLRVLGSIFYIISVFTKSGTNSLSCFTNTDVIASHAYCGIYYVFGLACTTII